MAAGARIGCAVEGGCIGRLIGFLAGLLLSFAALGQQVLASTIARASERLNLSRSRQLRRPGLFLAAVLLALLASVSPAGAIRHDYDGALFTYDQPVDVSTVGSPGFGARVDQMGSAVAPAAGTSGQLYDPFSCFVAPNGLLDELAAAEVKHDPLSVVRIARDGSGRVVFLEAGNSRAGLAHIVGQHGDDFARRGTTESQIPDLVTDAASRVTIVGHQGSGTGRPIYEVVFNGQTQRVAVTVGDNGFIVGANGGV